MAYRPSEGRNQKKQSPPEPPNVVPLMNLFLTLIPFLITMVVVTQVAMVALNFSATGGGAGDNGAGGGNGSTEKEVRIIIMASSGNQMNPGFEVREQDGQNVNILNSDNKGEFDFVALNRILAQLKNRNQNITSITITPYPDVLYGTLIQTIDLCKNNGFPNVVYSPARTFYGEGG